MDIIFGTDKKVRGKGDVVEEENDEGGSSGSEMDTTREVFEVEYDIDSEEGEERPPQAYGKTQDFSSAGNSDTLVPPMRIELMTFGLQDQRSATEL